MKFRSHYTIHFSEKQMLFQAYLFSSMIDKNNEILKELSALPRKHLHADHKSYINKHDAIIKDLVAEYRYMIFEIIHENEFCSIIPEMRPIRRLEISDMKKCILLMTMLDFNLSSIANLLYSSRQSIYAIRHSLNKDYSKFLKKHEK